MEQAQRWVALSDGGSGLEGFAQKNFNRPDLVLVLDFYHASNYLEKLAKALHPQDEAASQSQAEQWCSLLKAEGGPWCCKCYGSGAGRRGSRRRCGSSWRRS
jgi:hypothetical protein